MKRHGHVVAELSNGEIVSGIVSDIADCIYYVTNRGFVKYTTQFIILKDLRSEFYAGQECEFWDDVSHTQGEIEYLVFDGNFHFDKRGVKWEGCKAIDSQAQLKAEIEQKRKELAELEAKLKQENQ